MLLEQQRKAVWGLIRLDLPSLAVHTCSIQGCNGHGIDRVFPHTLANEVYGRVKRDPGLWPPTNNELDLRTVMRMTHNCGDVPLQISTSCGHEHGECMVTQQDLRAICKTANDIASGLCATCIRGEQAIGRDCSHSARYRRWAENDPYI